MRDSTINFNKQPNRILHVMMMRWMSGDAAHWVCVTDLTGLDSLQPTAAVFIHCP